MGNLGNLMGMALVVILVAAALGYTLFNAALPRASQVFWQHQPTPVPTHTPVPTLTPTPTPHPTPGTGDNAFYVAVSTMPTLEPDNVSARRYHTADRRLQLPQCNSAQARIHPREYWHILLTPPSARLRHLYLDGFDQLTAFGPEENNERGVAQTLMLDGSNVNVWRYTTVQSYPCGDNLRPGLGGAYVTIELTGE